MDTTLFDDFARRWLLSKSDEFVELMIEVMLQGPIGRVPPRFRPLAKALRVIRNGGKVRRARRK